MYKVSCFYQKVHNFLLCRPTMTCFTMVIITGVILCSMKYQLSEVLILIYIGISSNKCNFLIEGLMVVM